MSENDLAHTWGHDIGVAAGGDLLLVSSSGLTRERVMRRLLTSPGDYIWSLKYGAGLSRIIGKPIDTMAVEAIVRLQMRHESSVRQEPAPVVRQTQSNDQRPDTLTLSIQYVDSTLDSSYDLVLDVTS